MAIVWYRSDESGCVLFVGSSQACSYGNCLVLLCETGSSKCAELAYGLLVMCFLRRVAMFTYHQSYQRHPVLFFFAPCLHVIAFNPSESPCKIPVARV